MKIIRIISISSNCAIAISSDTIVAFRTRHNLYVCDVYLQYGNAMTKAINKLVKDPELEEVSVYHLNQKEFYHALGNRIADYNYEIDHTYFTKVTK